MVAIRTLSLALLLTGALAMPSPQDATAPSSAAPTPLPSTAASSPDTAASQLDQLADFAYNVTTDNVSNNEATKRGSCSLSNLRIRRDWRFFSSSQKKAYIKSVRCLQQLPARTPSSVAAGAKTRYDDFVVTHIQQTLNIHYTGTFLAWHRYFIYQFEQALRDECGYTGDYPYWNWPADANSLETSPVFDGSDTSMSGNGAYVADKGDIALTMGNYPIVYLPAGTGGGCVTSGPFVNYTVNLGPAALNLPGGEMTAQPNPLDYNPRCLKRDLTTAILQRYANAPAVVKLILENKNIWDFQMVMQGVPGSGSIGVHGGGHYSMGGDPGRDVFVSPGDPAFWLHHGMIDRVWWIWQTLDLKNRLYAISGTGTFMNLPASPNTTLSTMIDLGYANGGSVAMQDLMSTIDGPFCYVYL
ncbi:tyrosinase [Aspergillus udagawae]|nr:tyrosinase [Aspergillus udagawae]GFF59952.1 tyrosinase [Aspergillus udagawae]GFG10220.1 tyrosinase [Aspergillus udagawae]